MRTPLAAPRRIPGTAAILLLPLAAVALLAVAHPTAEHFANSKQCGLDVGELGLFPSGRFLREASLGHRQLVADLGWLTAVQYYGKHRQSDRRYLLAPHLFGTITDLDPAFENAYFFGSLVLVDAGLPERAERLLRRGVERNPNSWRLRFELGFFHYVITRSHGAAAAAFEAAARLPDAPAFVRRFAAVAYQRAGDKRTARLLWRLIAQQSENEEIRRMARERLAGLEAGPR